MFRTTLRAIIRRRTVAAPAADWRSTNRSIARRRTPSASLASRGAPTTPPEPVHGATAPAPDAAQPEPPVRSAKRASRRGGRPSAGQQRPRTGVRAPWARPWAPSRTGRHHIRHTCPIHPARPTVSAGGSAAGRSGGSKRWLAHIFHPSPSTPPVPKWRNDAIPHERRSRRAPESYAPATFSRPVDAPDRGGGGGRRPSAPGAARSIAAAGASTGVARPDEAEKAPAEPARGGIWRSGRIVRASTPDALGDFRMIPRLRRRCGGVRGGTILPERQNRNPMGSAERPDAPGVGGGAPARPRGPTPTTTRPRTPPDTPDEPPTTPRTRLNRLHQRSGQHRRSSPPTAPPTTGARTRVCCASFRLLRPSTLHCTRKESVVEGEGAQQTERSAAEGEAGAAESEGARRRTTGCIESSVVSAGLACLFRRFRRWGWRG